MADGRWLVFERQGENVSASVGDHVAQAPYEELLKAFIDFRARLHAPVMRELPWILELPFWRHALIDE